MSSEGDERKQAIDRSERFFQMRDDELRRKIELIADPCAQLRPLETDMEAIRAGILDGSIRETDVIIKYDKIKKAHEQINGNTLPQFDRVIGARNDREQAHAQWQAAKNASGEGESV